jgi:hypothetical protein
VEAVTLSALELLVQFEHPAEPVEALKWPAKHAVGVPPSAPVSPAFATQSVMTVLPMVVPVPLLAGHAVGLPLPQLIPKKPALATHAESKAEPNSFVPVLAGQSVHGSDFPEVLYLPAAH